MGVLRVCNGLTFKRNGNNIMFMRVSQFVELHGKHEEETHLSGILYPRIHVYMKFMYIFHIFRLFMVLSIQSEKRKRIRSVVRGLD